MSTQDVERFIADIKADPAMQADLATQVSGVESIVAFAKSKGYDITTDDVRSHINELTGHDLSDADLDAMAGGKGSSTPTEVITTGPSPIIYGPVQTETQVVVVVA